MKNLKIILMLAITLFSTVLFVNCENENLDKEEQSLTPDLIGKIHNKAMDNFKNNFENNKSLSGEELVDEIIKFSGSYLKDELKKESVSIDFNYDLNHHRELFDTEKLAHNSFYKQNDSYSSRRSFQEVDENYNLYEKINFIYDNNFISSNEKEILTELIEIHQLNYEKLISNTELQSRILSLKNNFESLNLDINNSGTAFTASTIEIAKNSSEWWEENLYSQESNRGILTQSRVAPWVAADVIGGAVSGLFNIFSQGATNGFGEINAGGVIAATLYGGVTSSLAPWSRIANLF